MALFSRARAPVDEQRKQISSGNPRRSPTVVEAWPELSPAVRAGILAMVRAELGICANGGGDPASAR
ncbi:MAG: hypothetical protein O7F17_10165 [Planctomycetota bacterium]|nr:hypothetical protein [Planctomycetota bacterium]